MVSTTEGAVWVEERGDAEAFLANLDAAAASGARALMLLACDGNELTPEQVDARLQSLTPPVFGGVFPGIVHGGRRLSRGSLIVGLDTPACVREVTGLGEPDTDFVNRLDEIAGDLRGAATMMVLVDGLAPRIASFLYGVYDHFGPEPAYLGGGAGSLGLTRKPCIFSNRGLLEDCAQLVSLPLPAVVGVEHGWRIYAGPFLVTEARDNVIRSLDFRPALEVYREVVEAYSGESIGEDNFFDVAKGFPFGLEKPDGEVVVRDPVCCNGTDLVCVGEVPENFMVHLLKGSPRGLIGAAGDAARKVGRTLSERRAHGPVLLFDCVSRVLFLGERFDEEIATVGPELPGDLPLVGALTLGEIADDRGGCLEFFNKTLVLASLMEP